MANNNFFKNMAGSGQSTGLPKSSENINNYLSQKLQEVLDLIEETKTEYFYSFTNVISRYYVCYPIINSYVPDIGGEEVFNMGISVKNLQKILDLSEEDRQAWIIQSCNHRVAEVECEIGDVFNTAPNIETFIKVLNEFSFNDDNGMIIDSYGDWLDEKIIKDLQSIRDIEASIINVRDEVVTYLGDLVQDMEDFYLEGNCPDCTF